MTLAAFDAEFTINGHKAEQVQRQVASQACHLPGGAVQGQGQFAVRSGRHGQFGVSSGDCIGAVGRQAVVDHRSVFSLAVHREAQFVDRDGQTVHAFKGSPPGRGLSGGPTACLLIARDLLGQKRQAQLHIREANTQFARTHKSFQVVAADQQHVHHHQGFIFLGGRVVFDASQFDLALFALDAKVAFNCHKTKQVQLKLASQAGQLAVCAVHAQLQAGFGAGGNHQLGLAVAVFVVGVHQAEVHHRAVTCLAVDLQSQRFDFNRQALDAVNAGFSNRCLCARPAARFRGIGAFFDLLGHQRNA